MFDYGTHIKKLQNELQMLQLPRKESTHFDLWNTINIDDKIDSIDDNEENEEKVVMVIDAKTDVLLQTADCIISNPRETKELKIKVLLDPGSQKTYLCKGLLKTRCDYQTERCHQNLWKHKWAIKRAGWV